MDDVKKLEQQLAELSPASLPVALLDRLDTAMTTAASELAHEEEKIIVTSSDNELGALEDRLRVLAPYGLPEDMISRLDQAMSRWHEAVPVEEKIVPMNPAVVSKKTSWFGLRSTAAVAILGAGAAFLTTGQSAPDPAITQRIPDHISERSLQNTRPAVFTPEDARASVISANDHGVVWTKNGQPVRCFEVVVNNKYQFIGDRGERLIVEQPKREVRFTKVRFD